jgi:hypothetical protein
MKTVSATRLNSTTALSTFMVIVPAELRSMRNVGSCRVDLSFADELE